MSQLIPNKPQQYLQKMQQGGSMLDKLLKSYDKGLTSKQDGTKVKPKPALENKIAPVDQFGRVLPKAQWQGEIKQTEEKSLRQKMMSGLNYLDRDGKNMVAGLATEPVKAGLRLLRPDNYFKNVTGDSDIGGALGAMAMDAVQVAPAIAGTVGKFAKTARLLAEPAADLSMLREPAPFKFTPAEGENLASTMEKLVDHRKNISYINHHSENVNGLTDYLKKLTKEPKYLQAEWDKYAKSPVDVAYYKNAYHDNKAFVGITPASSKYDLGKFDTNKINKFMEDAKKPLKNYGVGADGDVNKVVVGHIDPGDWGTAAWDGSLDGIEGEPNWMPAIDPNDLAKKTFVAEINKTHSIPEEELHAYFDEAKKNNPNLSAKEIGFVAKRKYNNRIREDFQHGAEAPLTDEFNKNMIEKHKLRTIYTPQENLVTSQYTRGYDSFINKRVPLYSEDMTNAVNQTREQLESLIKTNKVQEPMSVFRGEHQYTIPEVTGADGSVRTQVNSGKLQVGDVYEPGSFLSTSVNPKSSFGGSVQHEIALPGGGKQSILYPNAMGRSEFPHEYEGILPSKLKLRIDAVEPEHYIDPFGENTPTGKVKYKTSIVNPYSILGALGGAGLLSAPTGKK